MAQILLKFVTLLVLVVSLIDAVDCSAKFPLNLHFMGKVTEAGNPSTCADGECFLLLLNYKL